MSFCIVPSESDAKAIYYLMPALNQAEENAAFGPNRPLDACFCCFPSGLYNLTPSYPLPVCRGEYLGKTYGAF